MPGVHVPALLTVTVVPIDRVPPLVMLILPDLEPPPLPIWSVVLMVRDEELLPKDSVAVPLVPWFKIKLLQAAL